jgi:diamine N-acetyltransferase
MNIRQATIDDAKAIAKLNVHVHGLHREALPHVFKPPIVDDEMISLYAKWISQDNATIFIAEDGGQPIGLIYALVHHRPESPFSHARHYILVDQMSVNPEYYGTGVADMLMQAVKDLGKKHDVQRIILDVWDFNGRAKRFYEKQGFTTLRYQMQLVLE